LISVLVPFRANGPRDIRIKSWKWIEQRWRHLLPDAEICLGTDIGQPFSKSVAVNDAYYKSRGDMLVIVDADSWVEYGNLEVGIHNAYVREHLVVPWWTAYRLTKEDSKEIMKQDPTGPNPVTEQMRINAAGTGPSPASAAMVLCIQRVSFERVGGWDPRFRGWGSEDVSFGLSCWTLLGRNEYGLGEAFALYHPQPTIGEMRVWKNDTGFMNMPLWENYRKAQGRLELMEALCRQHPLEGASVPVGRSPTLNLDDLVSMPEKDAGPQVTPVTTTEQVLMMDGERIQI
jgi:hypothetical protein